MDETAVWNPIDLLLTQPDVPAGFALREHRARELDLDGGDIASQAHRMYGKARFLKHGDAIWSEATVFHSISAAHTGWQKLVDHHKAQPGYDNVRDVVDSFGDASYVHTGTMQGRSGLWAAVRRGVVVHRFNTYGVRGEEGLPLLRAQLAKQAPRSPSDLVLMCYAGLIESLRTEDSQSANEWWQRLVGSVERGGFTGLEGRLAAFGAALEGEDSAAFKQALQSLSEGVMELADQPGGQTGET